METQNGKKGVGALGFSGKGSFAWACAQRYIMNITSSISAFERDLLFPNTFFHLRA